MNVRKHGTGEFNSRNIKITVNQPKKIYKVRRDIADSDDFITTWTNTPRVDDIILEEEEC